ncbi:MAG: phosphatidate cytidylyltransferase [Verrucomicrobiales bacterium]
MEPPSSQPPPKPSEASEASAPSRSRAIFTFWARLFSTLILWAVVLGTIFSGLEIGFFFVIGGLGMIALWEYFRMIENMGLPCFRVFGMVCGALSFCGSFFIFRTYGPGQAYDFELFVLLFFQLAVFGRQMFEKARVIASLQTIVTTVFGLFYVVWLFNFVTKIVYVIPSEDPDVRVTGHFYVLYLVAVTKFSDVGAYLIGSLIGKHPMVPNISPKKTWEGFFGALGLSTLASVVLYALLPEQLGVFRWIDVILLGPLLGFAAVAGDLAESIIKRSTAVKDSSRLLPGIGGSLDLIDSLLFTAPLLFLYLRLVLGVGV